jgi:hypothetical protein
MPLAEPLEYPTLLHLKVATMASCPLWKASSRVQRAAKSCKTMVFILLVLEMLLSESRSAQHAFPTLSCTSLSFLRMPCKHHIHLFASPDLMSAVGSRSSNALMVYLSCLLCSVLLQYSKDLPASQSQGVEEEQLVQILEGSNSKDCHLQCELSLLKQRAIVHTCVHHGSHEPIRSNKPCLHSA